MVKRVLIADDFADNRALLRSILKLKGFEVMEAVDGYQAVETAVAERPDLILMDIAMPVMDGIQAVQAIRQHEELADVPILAVTAYGDFYRDRAREVGCNAVLQKPIDADRLDPWSAVTCIEESDPSVDEVGISGP